MSADFQNFKRRTENERADLFKRAQVSVIEAILPFLDDIERAFKAGEDHDLTQDMQSWLEGFRAIEKSLKKRFAGINVREIDCSGHFDPRYHEALMHVDSSDHKAGEIVEILSKGYRLGDEVIRYAKVSVAK